MLLHNPLCDRETDARALQVTASRFVSPIYVQVGSAWVLQPAGNLGQITTTNNFNNNNDNATSPNTGTGLPRQLQFMLRFLF